MAGMDREASSMTPNLSDLARRLTDPQRRACLAMTEQARLAGKSTFTAGGAWSLCWVKLRDAICRIEWTADQRPTYRLTPLGIALKHHLEMMR